MSEEIKVTTENECLCKSKGFRKFLIVSLGSFVGVFCALNLFCALHKPPVPMNPYMFPIHPKMHHGMMKHHDCDCKCHKNFKKHHENFKKDFDKDFNKTKKEIDD